jgi:hypothetical protein
MVRRHTRSWPAMMTSAGLESVAEPGVARGVVALRDPTGVKVIHNLRLKSKLILYFLSYFR